MNLGRLWTQGNKTELAISLLHDLVIAYPNDLLARAALLDALDAAGRAHEFVAEFESIPSEARNSLPLINSERIAANYTMKARAAHELSDIMAANRLVDVALSYKPEDLAALSEKVLLLQELGDTERAQTIWDRIIHVQGNSLDGCDSSALDLTALVIPNFVRSGYWSISTALNVVSVWSSRQLFEPAERLLAELRDEWQSNYWYQQVDQDFRERSQQGIAEDLSALAGIDLDRILAQLLRVQPSDFLVGKQLLGQEPRAPDGKPRRYWTLVQGNSPETGAFVGSQDCHFVYQDTCALRIEALWTKDLNRPDYPRAGLWHSNLLLDPGGIYALTFVARGEGGRDCSEAGPASAHLASLEGEGLDLIYSEMPIDRCQWANYVLVYRVAQNQPIDATVQLVQFGAGRSWFADVKLYRVHSQIR